MGLLLGPFWGPLMPVHPPSTGQLVLLFMTFQENQFSFSFSCDLYLCLNSELISYVGKSEATFPKVIYHMSKKHGV